MRFIFSSKNILRFSVVSITWFFLLNCIMVAMATTGVALTGPDVDARGGVHQESIGGPDEPSNLLRRIEERNTEKDSLLPVSPLGWLHDSTTQAKQDLYDATGLNLGFTMTHVFQWISEALPGEDTWGTATTTNLVGNWDLIDKGEATLGQAVFLVQGRWDYGTTGPQDLATFSLGSLLGTANTFAA